MASSFVEDQIGLMDAYSPKGNPTNTAFSIMRRAIRSEKQEVLSNRLVRESHEEMDVIRTLTDDSSQKFFQALVTTVLGYSKVRFIEFAKGTLEGPYDSIETVIPIDRGNNPYWKHKERREGYSTIDAKLAAQGVQEALVGARNYTSFTLRLSATYAFPEQELLSKFGTNEGEVDLAKLARYYVDTEGYVGTQRARKPTLERFIGHFVPFVSHRQKQSLDEKSERELCQKEPYKNYGDIITDLDGYRVCMRTAQEAQRWMQDFGEMAKLGKFAISFLDTDNYYAKSKRNGFQSYNTVIISQSMRFPATVREVQTYHADMHFNAQIDESHPAFHRSFREKQLRERVHFRGLAHQWGYHQKINEIFGPATLIVPLAK